jgi:hypothetical protein
MVVASHFIMACGLTVRDVYALIFSAFHFSVQILHKKVSEFVLETYDTHPVSWGATVLTRSDCVYRKRMMEVIQKV